MINKVSKQTPATITAEFATLMVLVVLVSSLVSQITTKRAMNIEPAMTFRNMTVVTNPIRSGRPITIEYDYDKRADCSPPEGYGDYYYRVYPRDDDGAYRRFYRVEVGLRSNEAAGKGQHAVNKIEMPALKPGHYALEFIAVFKCAGERELQFINPEMIPIVVTE